MQHAEGEGGGEEGVLIQLMAEPGHMRRSRHEGTRDAFDHPAVKTWRGLTVTPTVSKILLDCRHQVGHRQQFSSPAHPPFATRHRKSRIHDLF